MDPIHRVERCLRCLAERVILETHDVRDPQHAPPPPLFKHLHSVECTACHATGDEEALFESLRFCPVCQKPFSGEEDILLVQMTTACMQDEIAIHGGCVGGLQSVVVRFRARAEADRRKRMGGG